jgi:lipoyl(octanoyl) transferase
MKTLRWKHLGTVAYRPTLELQKKLWAAVRDEEVSPILLTLEHEPVITLGKRAEKSDLRVDDERLAAMGIDVVRIERGGQATYHGPGQLVCYAIVDVRRKQIGVSDLVRHLAGSIADELRDYGIESSYDGERPGLWCNDAKITAVGMRVKQGTSYHGAALNVTTGLDAFELIVPCGMPDAKTTRLADHLDEVPSLDTLGEAIGRRLATRLEHAFEVVDEEFEDLAGNASG